MIPRYVSRALSGALMLCLASAGAVQADPQAPEQALPQSFCKFPQSAPEPTASVKAFSYYAWRQFIALNWPAESGERGRADCSQKLGSSEPLVWQTFKTTDQLFLPGARPPGPWQSGDRVDTRLDQRAKAPAGLDLEKSIQQAVGGWLVDQQGNPTYYSILVNEKSYDYVVKNQFYNRAVLQSASSVEFPTGALEVKAAWRVMSQADDPSRYLTLKAQVAQYDHSGQPTGQYRPATVGLVGMHIVFKAPGFPQWTWATFEQVDNTDPNAAHATPYYNPQCEGDYCQVNQSPQDTGQPFTVPTPMRRVTELTDTVKAMNTRWQGWLSDNKLQYYRLISPQWPADPKNPGNPQGSPTPGTVANTTMETYIQPTSSCMDCHSTARAPGDKIKSNYSFIFLFAHSPAKHQQGGQP